MSSSLTMSLKAKTCYIRSIDGSLLTIYLPDCTEMFVGRTPQTNIVDTKCSKQQVRLYADYHNCTVTVQQIGRRASGLNGFKTQRNVKLLAKHNDYLEVLYGKYMYVIEFNPPPITDYEQSLSKKKRFIVENVSNKEEISFPFKLPKIEGFNGTSNDRNQKDLRQDLSNSEIQDKPSQSITDVAKENCVVESKECWENIDNGELLIYTPQTIQHRPLIAAYDMDGTLIKTKSGRIFPKDCNDWQISYPNVPEKLKQLHENGYKIVIFTNQGSLGTGKIAHKDFKLKIENIIKRLGIPIQAFIATRRNIYRKPAIGMWNSLSYNNNGSVCVNISGSFFVGDAAGRPKNWAFGKKKDHSCVDRLMALNIGLLFQTPEEHFLNHKPAPHVLPIFNPKSLPNSVTLCDPSTAKLVLDKQEEKVKQFEVIIIMVGCPGSGKSHFVKSYLGGYKCISRDVLGTWNKCATILEDLLSKGKSVVVDNTNPEPISRQRYITIAKRYKISVRCFLMATTVEHAKHNNKFRELTDDKHAKIHEMIINTFVKNYVPPSLDEGFEEIVKINFIPKFSSEQEQLLYEMYLLEN